MTANDRIKSTLTLLKKKHAIESYTALYNLLNIKPSTLSNWDKNNRLPNSESLKNMIQFDPTVNLGWILTGIGPQFFSEQHLSTLPTEAPTHTLNKSQLTEMIIGKINELSEAVTKLKSELKEIDNRLKGVEN